MKLLFPPFPEPVQETIYDHLFMVDLDTSNFIVTNKPERIEALKEIPANYNIIWNLFCAVDSLSEITIVVVVQNPITDEELGEFIRQITIDLEPNYEIEFVQIDDIEPKIKRLFKYNPHLEVLALIN